jgi:hypothetical protein
MTNSTLSGNRAIGGKGGDSPFLGGVGGDGGDGLGGAIFNFDGTVVLVNVSIVSNTVDAGGPGLGPTPLSDGVPGDERGGVYNYNLNGTAQLTLTNALLAKTHKVINNANRADCFNDSGSVTLVAGSNLIERNGLGGNACSTPAFMGDPQVGPLVDNGGDTFTHALLDGSPAIDAGTDVSCPATDQRGRLRLGTCDIGAYERVIDLFLPFILKD